MTALRMPSARHETCPRLAGDKARGGPGENDLDAPAGIDHAKPVAGMQRRNGEPGARANLDQPFPGQPLDRFAYRRAAEADPFDQRALGGDAARREFQRDDHALERMIGVGRSRFRR